MSEPLWSLCVQRISTAEFNAGGQSLLRPTSGFLGSPTYNKLQKLSMILIR
jgi:hypothetical protein